MKTPERFKWATAIMQPQSTDHLLELGCGTGILVELLANNLTTGKMVAIDQSGPMLTKAHQRNLINITAGKVTLYQTSFEKAVLKRKQFDLIYCFNFNPLWKALQPTLGKIAKLLRPHGEFYIFYDLPHDESALPLFISNLMANGFVLRDQIINQSLSTPAFCIKAVFK